MTSYIPSTQPETDVPALLQQHVIYEAAGSRFGSLHALKGVTCPTHHIHTACQAVLLSMVQPQGSAVLDCTSRRLCLLSLTPAPGTLRIGGLVCLPEVRWKVGAGTAQAAQDTAAEQRKANEWFTFMSIFALTNQVRYKRVCHA